MAWYPGWDSLDSVRTWHTVFEISGIAFLAFLVGAEILAFQYRHRKDELTAIAEGTTEAKRRADAEAAEARHKADVQGLQSALSSAREQTSQVENDLKKEREARLPRVIPNDKRQAVIHNLKALIPQPTVKLYVIPTRFDPEAIQYAKALSEILTVAGITVQQNANDLQPAILGYDAPGVWLWMRDTSNPPPDAEMIQKAFWLAGIYFDGQSHPERFTGDRKDSLLLAVSSKPPNEFVPPLPAPK